MQELNVNKLPWNGSSLGKIDDCHLLQQFKYQNINYWHLNLSYTHYLTTGIKIPGNQVAVTSFWTKIKIARNVHPCIADEIKYLFKIPKTGTHQIIHNGHNYIIFRINISCKTIIQDTELPHFGFDLPSDLILQIQIIWLFRYILGLSSTRNSIKIRIIDDKQQSTKYITLGSKFHEKNHPQSETETPIGVSQLVPLSHDENNIVPYHTKIPKIITDKWFTHYKQSIESVACNIFNIKKESDIPETIFYFSDELGKIIGRLNIEELYLIPHITKRLSELFQLGLRPIV